MIGGIEAAPERRRPRVGLYLDLRNPQARLPWPERYERALSQVETAEERGLEAVWTTEHHGFADGYLSQPLVFSAALAARTTRLRIGTAVVLAPFRQARLLAEEAAIVDILSEGRLELGIGAGYRPDEFEMFAADRARRLQTLELRAREISELWAAGEITPPPVQAPIPLWMGVMGPKGARIAGKAGAGLLWIDGELMAPYLEGLEAGGHGAGTARVGGLVNIFLADDPEQVRDEVLGPARTARATYRSGSGKAALTERAFPRLRILTPAEAAVEVAERVHGLPVSDVFCFESIGGYVGDAVDRHIELLCDPFPRLLEEALA
jgi:alkanesulfonate monooxygenase SsuD/methylene tetrahydromethanopterin reductase-like flavin-dependent oxidoreductase (luciferase family)